MAVLVRALNTAKLDPLTLAVMHAQFTRPSTLTATVTAALGRVLIGWVLARRCGVAIPPPVSVVVARGTGGYLSGLTRWRRSR